MKLDETRASQPQLPGSGPRAGAPDLHAACWRREMECTQAQSWFHDALPKPLDAGTETTTDDGHLVSRLPLESPRAAAKGAPVAGRVHAPPDGVVTGSVAPGTTSRATTAIVAVREPTDGAAQPRAGAEASARASPPAVHDPAGLLLRADRPAEPLAKPARTPLPARAARQGEALPVRVHVEGDAGHAGVWIGLDATAHGDLALIGASLGRWLLNAGYGSSTWTCNGRPMRAPAAAPAAAAQADHPTTAPVQGDSR